MKSGLSEADYLANKKKALRQRVSNQLRATLIRAETDSKKSESMLSFLEGFADVDFGKVGKTPSLSLCASSF